MYWHGRSEGLPSRSYSNEGRGEMNQRHFMFVLFSFCVISWICSDTCPKVVHLEAKCDRWGRDWEDKSSVFCNKNDALGVLQIVSFSLFPPHALPAHSLVSWYWQKVWRLRKLQLSLREVSSGRENWRGLLSSPFMPGRMYSLHHEVLNWFWMPLQLTEVLWQQCCSEHKCQTAGEAQGLCSVMCLS